MKKKHNIPRSPMKFLLFIGLQRKWIMMATVSVIVIAVFISILVTYQTKIIIDMIETGLSDAGKIWTSAFILGGLLLINDPIWRVSGLLGAQWSEWSWKRAYDVLFERLIHHSDKYFQDRFAGAVTNKIHHVSQGLFDIYVNTLWGLLTGGLVMIFSLILVARESWIMGGVFIGWIIGFFILLRFLLPKKRRLSYISSHEYSRLKGISVDIVTNSTSVRHFVGHKSEIQRVADQTEVCKRADIRSWYYSELIKFILMMKNNGITFLSLALGIWLWIDGQVSAGDMLLFFWLADKVSGNLHEIGKNFNGLMKSYGEIDEGLEELLIDYHIVDKHNAKQLQLTKGAIAFRNVSFAYTKNIEVFKDLDIHIPGGQKVGLIGESGAGKSTLVQLLLRQYDIQGGAIEFDEQNIGALTQDSIRTNIAFIPQDPNLFHRTIRENISYGRPDATLGEVKHAAKLAQAHEFIKDLEKGYDTYVGERGVKLSGGQRQRIIIARAILKDAPILILDEATSALDSESEHRIQKALVELMKGKTVIAIAHRLSTIKHLDRILVLDQGEVIEDGSHDELQKLGGHYADLWTRQVDGFIGE